MCVVCVCQRGIKTFSRAALRTMSVRTKALTCNQQRRLEERGVAIETDSEQSCYVLFINLCERSRREGDNLFAVNAINCMQKKNQSHHGFNGCRSQVTFIHRACWKQDRYKETELKTTPCRSKTSSSHSVTKVTHFLGPFHFSRWPEREKTSLDLNQFEARCGATAPSCGRL